MLPYPGDPRRSPPFSSSLSPSAAPFPAADPTAPGASPGPAPGRDLPTAPSVYAAAGGEWGAASWMEPPASYMAPVAAATPPGYQGEASHSAPYGMYSRNNFSNFGGLRSLRSESSNSISEKQPGTCQESSEALSNGFGISAFHQQQSAFVSKLLDHSGAEDTVPYPPQQDLNQYHFGSAYDKYMTQLSSCSTDTRPHIFSTRYVDSSEMAKATVPVMNDTFGESSFSFSSYMNPIRINLDYFDCVWNEQKNHGHQTTDKQHGKWNNSDGVATVGNYPLNPLGDNHLGADCLGYGRPMHETSERKHDLGSFNSKLSSSEVGFVQPREFSSEMLEVNNTTVDSPCWKGTPATYQPSVGIMENDAPQTVIGTISYSSSHQNQKAPELSSEYPLTFPEYQEASGPENDPLKLFKLPMRCNDSKDHKEVPPTDVRVHTNMADHASYLPDKQHAGTQKCYGSGENPMDVVTSNQQESSCPASKPKLLGEHSGSYTGGENEITSKKVLSPIGITDRVDVENLTSGSPHKNSSSPAVDKEESTQKRGEDPSQCYPGVEGNTLNISCDSGSSTRAIFLKLMHDLSVVLLSTCKGASSLQEDEEELLQAVIQNLTAASSKRSKAEQKVDDVLSNPRQTKLKSVNCGRNNFRMEMHEHSPQDHADSEFKTTVSQVLPNHPEDKMLDDSEVSHASIYKNLWIEAEASACKLKYELQLARMKLATLKDNNNTLKDSKTVPDTSGGSKGPNSCISTSKPENNGKESINSVAAWPCHGGDIGGRQSPVVNRGIFNGVDADVFARFKVLQSRVDNISSFCGTEREAQQEASKKSYSVEDAVMARMKVLKSRPDNVASSSQENIKLNAANDVDDTVMARLRILESRPSNVTFLSQESSKWQPDESTNRDNVDDAIMARLRILESRPTNVPFWDQESSKQSDASRKREDRVDDAVMARLKILKARPDNITSTGDASKEHDEACSDRLFPNTERFAEQCTKFLNCDDLADLLERNNSVGGLDFAVREANKTGCSADVGAPNGSEGTPDDVKMKGTVQGEDNLEEYHASPQTSGDSVCVEGSHEAHSISSPVHQCGSSPPEWEHVLKENFFHPGK